VHRSVSPTSVPLALVVVLSLGSPGRARAQAGAGDPFQTPTAALSLSWGPGAPNGALGVEGQFDPLRWVSLSAGAGTNGHLQLSGMGRLRVPFTVPSGTLAVTAGFGLSWGKDEWTELQCCFTDDPDRIWEGTLWWKNHELGVEWRTTHRWIFKMLAGWAVAGNPEVMTCHYDKSSAPCDRHVLDWLHVPYAGLSAGRTWR